MSPQQPRFQYFDSPATRARQLTELDGRLSWLEAVVAGSTTDGGALPPSSTDPGDLTVYINNALT